MGVVYKVMPLISPDKLETELMRLSAEGWRVVCMNKKMIILGKKVKT